jgi:hypothetical protein
MADFSTTAQKVATAKEKKEIADQAFKEGKITEGGWATAEPFVHFIVLNQDLDAYSSNGISWGNYRALTIMLLQRAQARS